MLVRTCNISSAHSSTDGRSILHDVLIAGLVLKIFLALLPMLLTFMNKRAGMQSLAEIDFGVFQKYFIFQARRAFGSCIRLSRTVHRVLGLDPAALQLFVRLCVLRMKCNQRLWSPIRLCQA